MEDRARRGMDMMPAPGAGPGLTPLLGGVPLEAPDLLALRAVSVLTTRRMPRAPKVLKAGSIVREFAREFHERVLRILALGSLWIVAVDRGHSVKILDRRRYVKILDTRGAAGMP